MLPLWFSKRFNATPNHQLNYFLNLLFEFSRFLNACDCKDINDQDHATC